MEIRKAVEGDIEALVEFMKKSRHSKGEANRKVERIGSSGKLILVLENDSRLLGYIGIEERGDNEKAGQFVDVSHFAHLICICIDPDFRNKGYGSRLVLACDDIAREWGKTGIWLDCRKKFISFYGGNGYNLRGDYMDKGESRYAMAKILRRALYQPCKDCNT